MRASSFLPALLCLAAVAFHFTGCFETNEEITVAADGSGTYSISTNMSSAMAMVGMLQAADSTKNSDEKIAIRNEVSLSELVDDYAFSAEEKSILSKGLFRIVMNQDSSLFTLTVDCPFPSLTDLPTVRTLCRNLLADPDVFKALQGATGEKAEDEKSTQKLMSVLYPAPTYFSCITTKNSVYSGISNQKAFLKSAEYDSLSTYLNSSEGVLFRDMRYNTVVRTAQPITYSIGPSMQLSSDKRQVSFSYTTDSLVKIPTCAAFEVRFK